MSESLVNLAHDLEAATTAVEAAVMDGRYRDAATALKRVMKASGQMYARLTTLSELQEDGYIVAAVDRAVKRGDAPMAIPGDVPLPFAEGVRRAVDKAQPSRRRTPATPRRKRPSK